MSFFLFILVTATLFIRPAEIVPALRDQPIYEMVVLTCFAVCCPAVLRQLTLRSLAVNPLTACIVGYLGILVLSGLWNFGPGQACEDGFTFFKVLMYYLLLVAAVNTPGRLRAFLRLLAVLILALTVLALLQYHGIINIEALASIAQRQENDIDATTGEAGVVLVRLCSTGIFHNPNDLSRILVVGMVLCLYAVGDSRGRLGVFWLIPLGVFGYALVLTHSRGGFMALLSSLAVLGAARFGKGKLIALAAVVLPLLFVVFAGRQTQLSTSEGTGHQRVQLWSDGFAAFKEAPVLGIGMDAYPTIAGRYVAHNSFVHSYVELGFLGGTLFAAACYLAVLLLMHREDGPATPDDIGLQYKRPYILAIIVGYLVGLLSSSRNYSIPTYQLLGLAAVYGRLAAVRLPGPVVRFDMAFLRRATQVSFAVLGLTYLFVRVSLR